MKNYFLLFSLCFCLSSTAQTSTFTITYNGFTPQAQASFQYAAGIWSRTVSSSVPIKVLVHFVPLSAGNLGITFPNGRLNFQNAPLANHWYSTSLANSIAGIELNLGEVDIEIYLNSTINWYYDSTGTVPAGKYDFATIAIHELCHGLGFLSIAKKVGSLGSFGLLAASDFSPLTTSYPWPNLDTLPSVFDYYIVNNLMQKIDSFPNPSNALGNQFTGNNLYFNGPNAKAANGGTKPRLYAVSSYALGSSVTHLNEITYPAGNANEMMTPNAGAGYKNHNPGPICIGILKDIGWTINPLLNVNENVKDKISIRILPNPIANQISISTSFAKEKIKSIEIKNMLGETVMDMGTNLNADISNLSSGVYFVIVNHHYPSIQKFIKQ